MCTLEPDVIGIRGFELRLIRCTITFSQPSDSRHELESLDGHINDLLNSIERGNYVEALTSEPSFSLVFRLDGHESLPLDADRVYSELVHRAESFLRDAAAAEQRRRAILVMCIAIAAFLGFTQSNFTGPLKGTELSKCLLCLDGSDEWDNWARNQFMSAGSDLLGKFSNLQYLVLAKMLLMRMKDLSVEIGSLSWWLARVLLLQLRVLDERSSSLSDLLHVYMGEALQQFSTSKLVRSYWEDDLRDGESSAIVSVLHLEAGIMEYLYGRVDSCRMHFESAEMAAGLQLSVTGALGFRTVHQAEPKAQMVLVTNTSTSNVDNCPLTGTGMQTCDSNNGEDNWNLNQRETSEASDILRIPKLLENDDSKTRSQGMENGAHVTPSLTATQQAVILAYCLLIEKSSRHDELQRWDMAPYIEAINSQHLFYFTIRCLCDVLRIRWESSRSRTKECALLMMDNLVTMCCVLTVSHFTQAILLCSRPPPQRKLRWILTSLSATMLGTLKNEKKYIGSAVKTALISVTLPPKEMCFCFHLASFASHFLMIGSQVSLRLGFAPMGIPRHVIKKKSKEAFIAFKEALKFKRNSWQLWENYSHAAVDIGNISQALEGVQMILNMSNNKRVDCELLERITKEVEKRLSTSNVPPLITDNKPKTDQFCIVDPGSENQEQVSGASITGRSRETEQLLLLLGKVLQQIIKTGSGCGPEIWGLYAKWHRINGDLMMCSEALLKQVRSLQGSDTWKDRDRFKKFAKVSLELCQVYVEFFSSTGSIKQLSTAEMHLKNVIRQAQSFTDTEEFRDLQACYDEVKIKLQSNSMPS
ncbi:hypothetical protein AAZV13_06G147600 [Glycine max]